MADLSLNELAAVVSEHLEADGIVVAVVGGSSITAHAESVYTSGDIDFAAPKGLNTKLVAASLAKLGFQRTGRVYSNPDIRYTLDFVADTPYIDSREISEFVNVSTAYGAFKVYSIEDAISDRIAHFVHWNDREALSIAERVAKLRRSSIRPQMLEDALEQFQTLDGSSRERLDFARRRLRTSLTTHE